MKNIIEHKDYISIDLTKLLTGEIPTIEEQKERLKQVLGEKQYSKAIMPITAEEARAYLANQHMTVDELKQAAVAEDFDPIKCLIDEYSEDDSD